jgi:xylulokinase
MKSKEQQDLYLGIDVGTSSLKAYLIDVNCKPVDQITIEYDSKLPHYHTVGGVHQHTDSSNRVTVPPLMWIEALDLVLKSFSDRGYLKHIRAIGTSGQQHGSVYWKRGCLENVIRPKLNSFSEHASLFEICHKHAAEMFLCDSPIWMDSSTGEECKELELSVGGRDKMIDLTGSCATERFTASHIHRLYNEKKGSEFERVSLISSFIPSIFLGEYASIDYADGSGMNLLDINQCTEWSTECLQATSNGQAEQLRNQLSSLTSALSPLGKVSTYMQKMYGLPEYCLVVAGTGDNPSSACANIRREGDVIISLGTSHTMFGYSDAKPLSNNQNPDEYEGHTFVSPLFLDKKDSSIKKYMRMICFKNGANVRNRLVALFNKNWSELDTFVNGQLQEKRINNRCQLTDESIGFYYLLPEITPHTGSKSGMFRFVGEKLESIELEKQDALSVFESQCMALKLHAKKAGLLDIGVEDRRLIVTGGASESKSILFILAQVFGCNVYIQKDTKDSAAIGAACRAVYADQYLMHDPNTKSIHYLNMIDQKLSQIECVAKVNENLSQWYISVLEPTYAEKEKKLLNTFKK